MSNFLFALLLLGFFSTTSNADSMKVKEILPRLDNMTKLVEQLRQRVKIVNIPDISAKDLKSLNLVDNAVTTMKTDLGLFDPVVINDPEHMVSGNLEKYANLAGILITINSRTCEQLVALKKSEMGKEKNKKNHEKIISNMQNNCQDVKKLISKRTIGIDINELQLDLNAQILAQLKLW